MAHILSTGIDLAGQGRGVSSDDAATAQNSPPLSPIDPNDIELAQPKAAAPRPASPELELHRPGASTSGTRGAPSHKLMPWELAPISTNPDASTVAAFSQIEGSSPQPPADVDDKGKFTATDHSDFARAVAYGPEPGAITPATIYSDSDPLLLRSRLVGENDLRRRASAATGGRRKESQLQSFYARQNQQIEALLKPVSKHAQEDDDEMEAVGWKIRALILTNIFANFALAALQLYAAISSLSLSLFATAADSIFDPFANIVLNWLHRKAGKLDARKWPVGGTRLESVGNIVYAFIMGSVSLILIVESIRDMATHNGADKNDLYVPSLIAVGVAFVTKAVLGVLNYMFRKYSSQLDMLWEDCRNDLFINGFGIFTSAAGAKIAWWIDPAGASAISVLIIGLWGSTAYGQFQQLCGKAAPVELLQLITYQAFLHPVEQIESVKAYSCGNDRYWVELHIVLPRDMPLHRSHDIGEALEASLEELPAVDRAFVHADFDTDHHPEHTSRKNR